MWNYSMLPTDLDLLPKYSKYALVIGIILALAGVAGIIYPFYASVFAVAFIAWLMIFSGIVAGYLTFVTDKRDWLGWLKALILIATGLFILFYPLAGIQALGLLLAIYFLLDAFAGFALGSMMKPVKGWWMWSLNGLLSLVLAIIFLVSWSSFVEESWLIGIFVGISLLFDGITLIIIANRIKKIGSGPDNADAL